MRHFPLFLDLQGRDVAVVGGGEVALRKVQALLSAGAVVTVVAPELHEALAAQLVQRTREAATPEVSASASLAGGTLRHVRAVLPADPTAILAADWFVNAWLVVAATDNESVNSAVAAAGARARKFVNVVDDSAKCSAIVPAVIVVLLYGERGTGQLLIASQVVLSLQLSFAVFPLVLFTGDKRKMGAFVSPWWVKSLAWPTAIVIAGLNLYLLWQTFA